MLKQALHVFRTPGSEEGVLSMYYILQRRQPEPAELRRILLELHHNRAGRIDVILAAAWSASANLRRGHGLHALRAATLLLRLTGVAAYARRRRSASVRRTAEAATRSLDPQPAGND